MSNYPGILDVGPLGVKWRGENIPRPIAVNAEHYDAQFGFTCAECGGSGVNQDPVIHTILCERWYEID